jgi:hypothetical protein
VGWLLIALWPALCPVEALTASDAATVGAGRPSPILLRPDMGPADNPDVLKSLLDPLHVCSEELSVAHLVTPQETLAPTGSSPFAQKPTAPRS